ncbi:Homeobox-leucine zipper protein HAT1 [Nosema granulosis]|uniref:Homeobox-leucine zipper protein HAT1 n=1 Tax=Nosema granulosis TaxID=83296 RepID=A0A9P6GXG2_9MICR|nr:Homeobox-leucine zipper protein HAT1 [Nosema granulosis]
MDFGGIKYERRIRITKDKTNFLKNLFVKKQYLNKKEKIWVSEYIGVPISFINNWFQNMRAYVRKKLNYTKHGHLNKCSKMDPEDVFYCKNCDSKIISECLFM